MKDMSFLACIFGIHFVYIISCTSLAINQEEFNLVDETLKDISKSECDIILMSSSSFPGLGTRGRSYMVFDDLKYLYSTMDTTNGIMENTNIANIIASVPCLVAVVKEDNFTDAFEFVKFINGLQGNPIKKREKHVILLTKTMNTILMQNKTVHFNVHIIPDESGKQKTDQNH